MIYDPEVHYSLLSVVYIQKTPGTLSSAADKSENMIPCQVHSSSFIAGYLLL